MRYRARLAKLVRRLEPRTFPPFIVHVMGQDDAPDAPPACTITTTFDQHMNATTTKVWRDA
jgi:hypothetical protein